MIHIVLYVVLLTYVCHSIEANVSVCNPNPCANNATCTPINSKHYQCTCPSHLPVGARDCDKLMVKWIPGDENIGCSSNPCKNGGICVAGYLTAFTCKCPYGASGTYCEILHPCLEIPDLCNHGTCVLLENNRFFCHCSPGYNGSLCQQSIPGPIIVKPPACDSNPCKNNGTCQLLVNNEFTCTCPLNFVGKVCELSTVCPPNYCSEYGYCTADDTLGIACRCQPFYTGKHCETPIPDPCLTNPCQNGAKCFHMPDGVYCGCEPGFAGKYCETVFEDICYNEKPCLNGGDCINSEEPPGFFCYCTSDYVGKRCEFDIYDTCIGKKCLNGGSCLKTDNGYQCRCPPEYTGARCEKFNTPPCKLDCSPGECVYGTEYIHCLCPDSTIRPDTCRD